MSRSEHGRQKMVLLKGEWMNRSSPWCHGCGSEREVMRKIFADSL
ncbi:MAG: hypothetical protein OJF52_002382 [Nitrospira sp.]|nr:MAG: hypothetical protein OJF52_002382 [Nitrospira sp.]